MTPHPTQKIRRLKTLTAALTLALLAAAPLHAQPAAPAPTAASQPAPAPLRIAVLDFDVLKGVDLEPAALTDQVNMILTEISQVTIVNRDQIKKIADEHKITLSGLVDSATAAKLGKFLSAQYIVVGRASRIGQTNYVVLKIIDVQTTQQTTVPAKAPVEAGLESLVARLAAEVRPAIQGLRKASQPAAGDDITPDLRRKAAFFKDKTLLLDISETHINKPLPDPAAQLAVANRLTALGIKVILPKDPVDGWKRALLESGRYGGDKVDFLLEGEGISAYAAEIQSLVSCRARVELRLVPLPGRKTAITERGVGAKVDLVEALAAKSALEDAGINALDALILQHFRGLEDQSSDNPKP